MSSNFGFVRPRRPKPSGSPQLKPGFVKRLLQGLGLRAHAPPANLASKPLPPPSSVNKLRNLLNAKKFFGGVPVKKIGSNSVNGAVFMMNMNNGSRKVIKIVKSPGGNSEFAFQKNAGNRNLAPKVYMLKSGVNMPANLAQKFFSHPNGINKINAFLMNSLFQNNSHKVMSVYDFSQNSRFSREQKMRVFDLLKRKVKSLHKIAIEHGDLHAYNAYVIIKGPDDFDVMLIDFGRSKRFKITKSVPRGSTKYWNREYGVRRQWGGMPYYVQPKASVGIIPNAAKIAIFKNLLSGGTGSRGTIRPLTFTPPPTKKRLRSEAEAPSRPSKRR